MYKLIKELKRVNLKLNDFLVKKRLRTKFLKNIMKDPSDIEDFFNITEINIANAFEWYKTEEGSEFWEDLANEFE